MVVYPFLRRGVGPCMQVFKSPKHVFLRGSYPSEYTMHYLKSIYQLVSCQGRNCFYSSIKKKNEEDRKSKQSKGSVQGPLCICILFYTILWPRVIIDLHFSINKT